MSNEGPRTAVEKHLRTRRQRIDARLNRRESILIGGRDGLPGHHHKPMLWTKPRFMSRYMPL